MSETPVSGARAARTRRDVVAAAVEVWAVDNSASLGAVATAAGVGRTTLHRYFPDREALVAAVDRESRERFDAATTRARIDDGTGAQALDRLLREVVALGPVLGLVFADNAIVDPDTWESEARPDPFGVVIVRGQADGSLGRDLPADWIGIHCWTALFGAHLAATTDDHLRRHAPDLLVRTVFHGIS
jgi:TetR/AcrR family transcriptional regulator, repressor for lfrA